MATALVVARDARARGEVAVLAQGSSAGLPPGVHPLDDKKPASGPVPGAAPSRWRGPQGRTGQFVVHCAYSHSGQNDPIVHPAMAGMSHRHDFYGAEGTDASTTPESMLADDTTCDKTADRAAYWHPTLYDHGEVVEPRDLSAYYRAAPGVDPAEVQPFPLGLAMLAGDQFATEPQVGEAAGWTCGVRTDLSVDPPECEPSAPLHLVLTFPDCWDGEYLDSVDHVSHVTYSSDGTCPDGFAVHVPQITVSVRFPISGPGHDLSLASGKIITAHGDFFNGWEPEGLEREIDACIKRGVVCDLASNREEEALFSYTG
ncbi:MAG: DUF1996 domain-containing protein [Acidimicrobiales bacterium]